MAIVAVLVVSPALQVMMDAPIPVITGGFRVFTTTFAKATLQLLPSRMLIVTGPETLVV